MNVRKIFVYIVLLVFLSTPITLFAQLNTTLTFEGLQDFEEILEFYNGGTGSKGSSGTNYGVAFGPGALALIDSDAGGGGNFANEPSPDTAAFWQAGDSLVMNVSSGFSSGFSFYYTSATVATVTVYDDIDGTGNVLTELNLEAQSSANDCTGDPTGTFCNWSPIGADFSGVAKSVDFSGTANQIAYDEITFGSSTPGDEPQASFVPVPVNSKWALITMTLLLGLISIGRLRHTN
jgi:hypothetical protein